MAEASVVPEEMLFQGNVQVLVPSADGSQEWAMRYLCLFCNPACFCLYRSELGTKKPAKHYVYLPPSGSVFAPDDGFQGDAGTSFRVEAQGGIWHFKVASSDRLDYWSKGFNMVIAIAQTRAPKKSMLQRASSSRHGRTVAKEGQGFKCDARQRKWQSRWFVLDGLNLQYFDKQGDSKPKGVVPLNRIPRGFLSEEVDSGEGKKAPPTEYTLVADTQDRRLQMCFSTPGDVAIWRKWLEEVEDMVFGVPEDRLEALPEVAAGELVHEYVNDDGDVVSMSATPSGMASRPTAGAGEAAPVEAEPETEAAAADVAETEAAAADVEAEAETAAVEEDVAGVEEGAAVASVEEEEAAAAEEPDEAAEESAAADAAAAAAEAADADAAAAAEAADAAAAAAAEAAAADAAAAAEAADAAAAEAEEKLAAEKAAAEEEARRADEAAEAARLKAEEEEKKAAEAMEKAQEAAATAAALEAAALAEPSEAELQAAEADALVAAAESAALPSGTSVASLTEYSLEDLRAMKEGTMAVPADVLRRRLENHLSAAQFSSTFGMAYDAYAALPKWRQVNLRKSANLF